MKESILNTIKKIKNPYRNNSDGWNTMKIECNKCKNEIIFEDIDRHNMFESAREIIMLSIENKINHE